MKRCPGCMEPKDENTTKCPICGFSESDFFDEREFLKIGTILQERYIVGEAIERRDTDIIYIGWDTVFSRKVAIQEFFPQYCAARSEGARLSIYTAQTRKELFEKGLSVFISSGKGLLRLYREGRIAETYSCFQENGTAYLVTAYWNLPTLEEYCQDTKIGRREARALIKDAIEAVKRLHENHLIHGSLDENSFWMGSDGRLILRWPEPARCCCGRLDGVDYGSPGPWTDVYGLGKIFFFLTSGKPYQSETGVRLFMESWHLQKRERKAISRALQGSHYCRTKKAEDFEADIFGKQRKTLPKASRKE